MTQRSRLLFVAAALVCVAAVLGGRAGIAAQQNPAVLQAERELAANKPTSIVAEAQPGKFLQSADPPVKMQRNGMWIDKDGNPTPYVGKDGTVGWFLASGYLRYGANCLQCHGPDALGSSFAPSLVDALKMMTFAEFRKTVSSGKQGVNSYETLVMPAFGDDKNVQCYIDDIYVYIRARSLGLLGRGRPSRHQEKPKTYSAQETACMGF